MTSRAKLLLFAGLLIASRVSAGEPTPEQIAFVEQKVRPLLADNCFKCHGAKTQSNQLRLDSLAAMLTGGRRGPAIVEGRPEQSLLIQAIRGQGKLKMPPGRTLAPQDVAVLAKWVNMGAPWPKDAPKAEKKSHWAFQPISNPSVPRVRQIDWPRNSIDQFILAKLEERQLVPSPIADRRTLIRRVTFDLVGLPPTPEEINDFVHDQTPDAFAKVVDRLLDSPRYGERWGRHWLDVARFADTKGYVFFQDANFPWAYTYRDYVIRSLNEDLPYDRFILEQIAADQLVTVSSKQALTALGFLSLGGRFMNNVHDICDDRIDVVTRGLMGLTVTCARCHDHKFDPISQKDYYALYGVFASCRDPEVPPLFEEPPRTAAYETFRKELDARERKLLDLIRAQFELTVSGARSRVAEYLLAVHEIGNQPSQDDFMLLSDGTDINPTMLKRWRAQLDRSRQTHDPVFAPWCAFAALPSKDFAAGAAALIREWSDHPKPRQPLNSLILHELTAKPPTSLADAAKRYGELLNGVERLWRAMRYFAPNLDHLPDPEMEQLRLIFHGSGAAPNIRMAELDDLELFPDRPSQGKLQQLRKSVEQWRISGTGAPPRAHALTDRPESIRPHVFLRGNPNQLGPSVDRRMPELFSSFAPLPFQYGSGRLELARAIVHPRNPLTARVVVNRVWTEHFGQGLVRTPSDFGLRGDPPSHPELLDYLAADFMRDGWSLKRLHRRILLSATYQQASNDRPDLSGIDPDNRLFAKMNRRRLDFESTRDALLATADRLDSRIGGPSVQNFLASSSSRRTLYGFIDRLQVPSLYFAYDFPNPDSTSAQRSQTTIPQQALFLMNSPFATECAQKLARRVTSMTTDTAGRIRQFYLICFGREPLPIESKLATNFVGPGKEREWELFALGLMSTNEFVFID